MRSARPILVAALCAALCAAGAACSQKGADPRARHVLVKYRIAPDGLAVNAPQKDLRCIAFAIEVVNKGYEQVAFDRAAFSLVIEGQAYLPANPASCAPAQPAPPATLADGAAWKAVVAFEKPSASPESRVQFKPAKVKDGLLGDVPAPRVEYAISSGN